MHTNFASQELCKEAIVWRQLRHENIAPFLGLCEDSELFRNRVALVSPWMSNGDLSSYLQKNPDVDRVPFVSSFRKEKNRNTERRLTMSPYLQAVQVATGMNYLHSQDPQVIHGDLRAVSSDISLSTAYCLNVSPILEQCTRG